MDAFTVSIALSLVISLLFTELYGLSAGGMIVPGYLALHLHEPFAVVLTLITAAATYGAVRLFSRFAIVYGRRRIVMMVLCGFLFGGLVRSLPVLADSALHWQSSSSWGGFHVIGFIIPGLIALWMDRQGWVETWAPLLTSSVVVRLALILIGVEVLQ